MRRTFVCRSADRFELGLGDAMNLRWKLAAVTRGDAGCVIARQAFELATGFGA
jgi:hypothetical protein